MNIPPRRDRLCAAIAMAAILVALPCTVSAAFADPAPGVTMAEQAIRGNPVWITTDHARIEALQADFRSGGQITQACLSCHTEAAGQIHQTLHWTWQAFVDENGNVYGKGGDSLNNFCISANRMQDKQCLNCHPGWGTRTDTINCLNCHGSKTLNWEEAFEDLEVFSDSDDPEEQQIADELRADIQAAVQAVVRPQRSNCGACHFKGGGGDGVKHGDLDSSLSRPDKALDVHMAADGRNFQCTRCHTTTVHNIAGRVYTRPAAVARTSLIEDDLATKITCESCHGGHPHKSLSKANDHVDKVACQSCHIPTFARVNPTKMSWDWSQAGRTRDGKPYKTKNAFGMDDYLSIKGQMSWEKNIVPTYFWYDGTIDSITARDKIDPSGPVAVSHPMGHAGDTRARIAPFKVHRSRQPYDKVHKTLLAPLLSGPDGYWQTLDWQRALNKGMQAMALPYSGEFDFVDTTYVFPITHMVAPKDNAVACTECHTHTGSRLAAITGVYMPGRDRVDLLDLIGWIAVFGSLGGVCLHGSMRLVTHFKR
ncbi:MAG: tetrathionate reductase family octaheme c-type cytochrome [Desulfatitalea sp.]|nr:tetrathionate reductase family octaheme c-type cytochrome [Desulfatitalea sp.]NNK02298.1 tetrathionate reductase family octaheme c-type cytochrome [Desulfatitalea sp.]